MALTMEPIAIMALALALLGVIKLIVIFTKPKAWLNNVVKPIYSGGNVTAVVALALAGISLYYLLQELTIIQIFGAMVFFALIMMASFATYGKELLSWVTKIYNTKGFIKRSWLMTIIWIGLLAWVLYALFM